LPTLYDLVSATLKLQRRGSTWWAPCPFHDEKTSSFKISEYRGKQLFKCFGCGAHGDKYDWVMVTQRVSFKEAQRSLGQPVKPDPAIIAARQAEQRRQQIIGTFRDHNPDSDCPDWLIAT
jgi:DNA primase